MESVLSYAHNTIKKSRGSLFRSSLNPAATRKDAHSRSTAASISTAVVFVCVSLCASGRGVCACDWCTARGRTTTFFSRPMQRSNKIQRAMCPAYELYINLSVAFVYRSSKRLCYTFSTGNPRGNQAIPIPKEKPFTDPCYHRYYKNYNTLQL